MSRQLNSPDHLFAGDHSSFADSVFTMTMDGTIQRLPGLARDIKRYRAPRELVSAHQDGPAQQIEEPQTRKVPRLKVPPSAGLDPHCFLENRNKSVVKVNYELYSYYLGAATSASAAIFLVLTMVPPLLDKLPGESGLPKSSANFLLKTS